MASKHAFLLAALLTCSGACEDRHPVGRRVIVADWDTVFRFGSADDSVLIDPHRVALWNERIVVLEAFAGRVSVFNQEGALLWSVGRPGEGPGEFRSPIAAASAPNGNLWVLDPEVGRITELSATGEVIRTLTTAREAAFLADFAVFRERQYFLTWQPGSGWGVLAARLPDTASGWQRPLPWPDTIPQRLMSVVLEAADPESNAWAVAFGYGPGFVLWHDTVPSVHLFIDPVPFQTSGTTESRIIEGRTVRVRTPADSARYAARALAFAGGELFVLFGGRPVRPAHASAPTLIIDVYKGDGSYLRSYELPFDSRSMTTDGRTFFLLRSDPYPQLVALRPRS